MIVSMNGEVDIPRQMFGRLWELYRHRRERSLLNTDQQEQRSLQAECLLRKEDFTPDTRA